MYGDVTPGAAERLGAMFGADYRVYPVNGGRLILKKLADSPLHDVRAEKMLPHLEAAEGILRDRNRRALDRLATLRERMNAIPGMAYDSYHAV